MPVFIVTPVLNGLPYLPHAAQSVLSQQHIDLRWIVIDGGSTDGTLDFLQSIRDSRLTLLHQSGSKGQSAAINQAFAHASAHPPHITSAHPSPASTAEPTLFAWLNADDIYHPNALSHVTQAFSKNPHAHWLIGQCNIIDAQGQEIRRSISAYKSRLLNARLQHTLLGGRNVISQPAVFWTAAAWQRVGPLNQQLHYTMDYDLWLKLFQLSQPIILPQLLASFRWHATSKSGSVNRRQFDEQYQVASQYLADKPLTRIAHRVRIEQIVWAYRILKLFGL